MEFLSIQGNKFTAGNRPIQLRGAGLGNWLMLEHFMLGIPGTDSQIRQAIQEVYGTERSNLFWDRYYSVYIDEPDIESISKSGLNHVRIPVNYKLFLAQSFEESTAVREIDRILHYLKKYQIWGIIDIHSVPGGQNPDWHSDNYTGEESFWTDPDAVNRITQLWREIAEYYKDEPAIGGYDLINEPCFFSGDSELKMIEFFKKCTNEIRKADTNHIIFYSGNTYSRDFSMFSENIDKNSSYTFHLYPFLQIPDKLKSNDISSTLKHSLYNDVSYNHLTENLQKPLWCGETGHPQHINNTYEILHQFISIMEEKDIAWALWPLKDCGEMAMIYPEKGCEWNRLTKKVSENWSFWDLFTQDSMLSAQQENDEYTYYRKLAQESTRAWRVFRRNLADLPFDKLLKALDNFRFENCTINQSLVRSSKGYRI